MTTIIGIAGFIGGFALGLLLAGYMLRRRSREDLVKNKTLRWTYGLAVWVFGAAGSWGALEVYKTYFLP